MGEKLWFGRRRKEYDSSNTRYYNPDEYPWAKEIEKCWPEIKEEVERVITEKDKSFKSNAGNYKSINANGWSSLSVLFWGLKVNDSIGRKCPVLFGMLKKIPGFSSASFSRLEPNVVLRRHHGETNAIMRCHFGIEIPAPLPACGIEVAGEEKGWEEGKWLFFNDAQYHSAWNKSNKRRIMLIIDVIRPEFLSRKNSIYARILAGYAITKSQKLSGLPLSLKILIFWALVPGIYIVRPVFNALGLNKLIYE